MKKNIFEPIIVLFVSLVMFIIALFAIGFNWQLVIASTLVILIIALATGFLYHLIDKDE